MIFLRGGESPNAFAFLSSKKLLPITGLCKTSREVVYENTREKRLESSKMNREIILTFSCTCDFFLE